MNIDNLTNGEAKETAATLPVDQETREKHPLAGKRVLAVLPNGFIHFGTLNHATIGYVLTDAYNLRYWKQRKGGLPEFARSGPIEGDNIDSAGSIYFDSALFFYVLGGLE